MSLNWDKILDEQESVDSEYSALPANSYDVVIDSAEAVKAGSGNQMIKVTCKVQGGPFNGRLLWTNIVFATDNATAMRFTLRKLKALGITQEWLSATNPNTATIAKKLEGILATAEVEIRQYQGEDRNEIKSFKALEGVAAASKRASSDPTVPSIPMPDIPVPDTDDEEPF